MGGFRTKSRLQGPWALHGDHEGLLGGPSLGLYRFFMNSQTTVEASMITNANIVANMASQMERKYKVNWAQTRGLDG